MYSEKILLKKTSNSPKPDKNVDCGMCMTSKSQLMAINFGLQVPVLKNNGGRKKAMG